MMANGEFRSGSGGQGRTGRRGRPPRGRGHPKPEEPEPPSFRMIDAHCHLDHMAGAEGLADEMAARGIGICCATVEPDDFHAARERFKGRANVCVGAGLHPWWLDDGRCDGDDVDKLVLAIQQAPFVAEVGLDLGRRHEGSRAAQLEAFEAVTRACAEHPRPGRVLSIHAVRSASDALDILERYDLTRQAACIFHWFSGTSEELARARRLGCWFSINEHMLKTKRGREYARIIEEDRLLLETDAPPAFDEPYAADEWERSLTAALEGVAAVRGADPAQLGERIAATGNELFSACFR